MSRPDISSDLIHFTKGSDLEEAFTRLRKIISERTLIAGTGHIKGNHECVCFSEAPLTSLKNGLVNADYYTRYSPFGIMVSKPWLFAQGGRPVIYQADCEYDDLNENNQWRHHRYEPREAGYQVDFTWEREWRIQCENVRFDQRCASIVVADQTWAERLMAEHDQEQDFVVRRYAQVVDEALAELHREPFKWEVVTLN